MEVELTRLRVMILQDGRPAYVIAASAGIHPTTLSQYAKGERSFTQKNLAKLCKEFNCNEDDLIGWYAFSLDE